MQHNSPAQDGIRTIREGELHVPERNIRIVFAHNQRSYRTQLAGVACHVPGLLVVKTPLEDIHLTKVALGLKSVHGVPFNFKILDVVAPVADGRSPDTSRDVAFLTSTATSVGTIGATTDGRMY